jgi:hypothetical protein
MGQNITQEAIRRKARSISLLEAPGVSVLPALPPNESESEASPPSLEEVAFRALCLLLIAGRGCGLDPETEKRVIDSGELMTHFTAVERAFIANPSPTEQDRVNFSWKFECAWVLLWALGYIEEGLGKPVTICDVQRAYEIAWERSPEEFMADARLKATSEILDQAYLVYHCHWAVRNAWLCGEDPPAGLNGSVVAEWHYALNWLTGLYGKDWDNITTDT